MGFWWRTLTSGIVVVLLAGPGLAKTLVLTGDLSARIRVNQLVTFSVSETKRSLTYRFVLPPRDENASRSQQIDGVRVAYQPEPASVREETDRFGNRFREVTWNNLARDARMTMSYEVLVKSELRDMESRAPFPLTGVPEGERLYLQAAEQVQSDDPAIRAKAGELTAGAFSEYGAVTAIMRFVANHITYGYNPSRYDALYSLESGDGNCQNYAHLALALLRAAGIPGRVVGGYTLKDKWKIPTGRESSLVQGMGQGGHAWLEIWYPDLGWLSYDPQQSLQFTSTRHIKLSHGLQVKGIVDTWRAAPPLPVYSETTDARYLDDRVNMSLKGELAEPRGYLASNPMKERPPVSTAHPSPPPKPAPPPPPPVKPLPPPETTRPAPPEPAGDVLFGNMKFPTLVELYRTVGDTGSAALEKETAEYVTSTGVYAQAFTVDRPVTIATVSLAMKKFGGDGTLYLDIVADDHGKPGLAGVRTKPIPLERIRRTPGYGWLDFPLPPESEPFRPGKYWIVLRHSGEAILNWFYTPGKRYGDPDDTRSTTRGWQWEDILNYDFVFKVAGRVVP